MSKRRLSARTKKRRAADQEVMDKMNDIFQKVKKCEHELTDTILSTPYFKARISGPCFMGYCQRTILSFAQAQFCAH